MSLFDVMMKTTEIELGLICHLWLVTLASEFTSLSLNFFSSQSINNNSRCSKVLFEDYMRESLYPTQLPFIKCLSECLWSVHYPCDLFGALNEENYIYILQELSRPNQYISLVTTQRQWTDYGSVAERETSLSSGLKYEHCLQ